MERWALSWQRFSRSLRRRATSLTPVSGSNLQEEQRDACDKARAAVLRGEARLPPQFAKSKSVSFSCRCSLGASAAELQASSLLSHGVLEAAFPLRKSAETRTLPRMTKALLSLGDTEQTSPEIRQARARAVCLPALRTPPAHSAGISSLLFLCGQACLRSLCLIASGRDRDDLEARLSYLRINTWYLKYSKALNPPVVSLRRQTHGCRCGASWTRPARLQLMRGALELHQASSVHHDLCKLVHTRLPNDRLVRLLFFRFVPYLCRGVCSLLFSKQRSVSKLEYPSAKQDASLYLEYNATGNCCVHSHHVYSIYLRKFRCT